MASSAALRQLTQADILEVDGRAFGFQAQVADARLDLVAAGDFLAVDPETDLAVDGADVVVVPFADALAQVLAREAAAAVGGGRRGNGFIFDLPTGKTSRRSS